MTKDNIIDRDQLQDDNINRAIDGLDIKDLIALFRSTGPQS